MEIIAAFILIILLAIVLVPLISVKWKGIITVSAVIVIAVLSSIIAIQALTGTDFEYSISGFIGNRQNPCAD